MKEAHSVMKEGGERARAGGWNGPKVKHKGDQGQRWSTGELEGRIQKEKGEKRECELVTKLSR